MNIGIVGLGLIGGSLAKAWKAYTDARVYGYDRDKSVTEYAQLSGAIDGALTDETLASCELVMLALLPAAEIEYVQAHADALRGKTVIDCAGTKQTVCDVCFPIAAAHEFCFVGGHPMAGTHHSGFKYSRESLFQGAPMVLVVPENNDIVELDRIQSMLRPLGFARFSVTTAAAHDRMIAFTSQLAHIVSNAYIKSPEAEAHAGFSAGSYKDLTRVAELNPEMWARLFLDNASPLLAELDGLIGHLTEYRDAIAANDYETLRQLLHNGSERKKSVS